MESAQETSVTRSAGELDAPPSSYEGSQDNTAEVPQRSKFFQKSSSFFSRSSGDGGNASSEAPSKLSVAGISTWAKNFKLPVSPKDPKESSQPKDSPKSAFSVLASGFGKRTPAKIPVVDEEASAPAPSQEGAFGTLTKGFLDTSRNAVKIVQTRARHLVSQNKRRYQEGGFDLDMTYITDSIIAMGFPAGDMSSGILGYVEGFYRNHMEEVIKFFETHHKGKYKVYNLCSERLYDVSLLEGKVASFPFDDHNCPPLHLVMAFCRSAYDWLRDDLENVVVVHCKAGKARTGLMISSLLLYLKFFPTAEECIANYNERRCTDGKGLILPSQLRYVKYFERVLKEFNGETPTGRMCILRGIRLHKCPYWIRPAITVSDHNGVLFSTKKHPRTKDMMPEDFWFSAPRKGIMVFALPGERCVADLNGDFKVYFHDRHGDFYCWLNTNMMESRQVLTTSDFDGFDKRRLPSPGFQVEIVTLDQNASVPTKPQMESPPPQVATTQQNSSANGPNADSRDNDDIFSDNEGDEGASVKHRPQKREKAAGEAAVPQSQTGASDVSSSFGALDISVGTQEIAPKSADQASSKHAVGDKNAVDVVSRSNSEADVKAEKDEASDYVHVKESVVDSSKAEKAPTAAAEDTNDFRAIAADASVFTFGDEDDYGSEED